MVLGTVCLFTALEARVTQFIAELGEGLATVYTRSRIWPAILDPAWNLIPNTTVVNSLSMELETIGYQMSCNKQSRNVTFLLDHRDTFPICDRDHAHALRFYNDLIMKVTAYAMPMDKNNIVHQLSSSVECFLDFFFFLGLGVAIMAESSSSPPSTVVSRASLVAVASISSASRSLLRFFFFFFFSLLGVSLQK